MLVLPWERGLRREAAVQLGEILNLCEREDKAGHGPLHKAFQRTCHKSVASCRVR